MEAASIVGIVLVRNEDLFVEQAVRNISAFCDRIILCDHESKDRTPEILRKLAAELPGTEFHALSHPRQSHDLLKPLAGTRTWVFGVDGDEIYDPQKLVLFRRMLLAGEFDHLWRIKGNVLHCQTLDLQAGVATGFTSPPSRSITKLYNFAAIKSWDGDTVERLHGGTILFQEGFEDSMKQNLQDTISWEASPLRCLHLCFLTRSSRDQSTSRENIMELYRGGISGWLRRLGGRLLGRNTQSRWKNDYYCRGPLATVNTLTFFVS